MILETEVFASLQLQGDNWATWKVPANLPYFQGHFPGNPIFPAVGIVDATIFLLRQMVKRPLHVTHFPVAKFLSPIQPEQTVRIELSILTDKEWLAEWKNESTAQTLATLRFRE